MYAIANDNRRLKTGGPLNDEYYGPTWSISETGQEMNVPTVIVPDPGDGSSEELAKRIVNMLNIEFQKELCGSQYVGDCMLPEQEYFETSDKNDIFVNCVAYDCTQEKKTCSDDNS